jgi:DNA-binding CsgD family transcriptional regulator
MPLTIAKAALVRRMAAWNYRDDEIADLLQIRRTTVNDTIRRAERDAAIRAERARGKTLRQLAEQFQVTVSAAKHIV